MEQNCELRPDIWSNLPDNTLENVLSKLPFSSLFRFRCVCKGWKALIESPAFTNSGCSWKPITFSYHPGGLLEKEGRHVDPFLAFPALTQKERTGTVLSPGVNHPLARGKWRRHYLPFSDSSSRYPLLSVDEGLFCFGETGNPRHLVVYNPLSRKWRRVQLPFSLDNLTSSSTDEQKVYNTMLVGLAVVRANGTYKLLVAGLCCTGKQSFIYDSSSNSWETSSPLPVPDFPHLERSLCCRGNLFWVFDVLNSRNVKRLVKYSFQLHEWTTTFLRGTRVAANRDHVFLFTPREDDVASAQRLGPEIKFMGKEVEHLLSAISANEIGSALDCHISRARLRRILAQGDFLYLVYNSCPLTVLVSGPQDIWSWVPRSKHVRAEDSVGVFTPTFRAFV